jgi:hypothetical protein
MEETFRRHGTQNRQICGAEMNNMQPLFHHPTVHADVTSFPPRHPSSGARNRDLALRNLAAIALILCVSAFFLASCADTRTPPAPEPDPGYTETIVMWENVVSGGNQIAATFEVDQQLAPINNVNVDHPARMTLVAYIRPDNDILRFEVLANDSVPAVARTETGYQGTIDAFVTSLDSLFRIDTAFTNNCAPCIECPCTVNCVYDTCGFAQLRGVLRGDSTTIAGLLTLTRAYKSRLEFERDSLGILVDNRYKLSVWLDDASTPAIYPSGFYMDSVTVNGQEIYRAQTDTTRGIPTTGMKGRGFDFDLDGFYAADPLPLNYGNQYRINWAECFSGNARCLSPGTHTMYAALSGAADTRITGTLVLTYAGERP